ncbi:MAG: thiamine phosphate synthase [Treponemataceae bacterium]
MSCNNKDLLLYAVTDTRWLNGKTLEQQVENAIKGGATCIQLREKNLCFDDFLLQAQKIKALTKKYSIPLFINDSVEVCCAVDADGVHVGQSDIEESLLAIRDKIGKNKILGVSVTTVEQAVLAQNTGADYLGVGAMFTTGTKDDAFSVSLHMLEAICTKVSIPVVAIGGITKENIYKLAPCKLAGVALVSAIFAQDDVQKATKEMHTIAQDLF